MVDPHNRDLATKKKELLSTAMQRTTEWIFSQELPSDVIIHVEGKSFPLHKFPLASKCGFIKKIVSESTNADLSVLNVRDFPGGAEAFELAAKFCYGINFEISITNIAMLRCAAEYLEMTEDYAIGNLVGRTEAYLNEVALKSLAGAVSVLHCSEKFLLIAEKVKMVNQCIDAIAYLACKDSQFCSLGSVDGWVEDLVVLRIDIFRRVLVAMMARGFKQYALAPTLMLYTQKSLRGLEIFRRGKKKIELKQDYEKRVVLETIVSLLPKEKNAISVSFLSMLLRAAIYLDTTVACRLDLEKRMSLQLGEAVLDDLLIRSYSATGDTLFDVDSVERIMMNYLEYVMEDNGDKESITPSEMERVGKLLQSYLAEIASDRNLSVTKFVSLSELIPKIARIIEDDIYRAIDVYLKSHPALSDLERKKLCSVMNCRKLSRDACAHAAQNDRLPIQIAVQVLNYEQQLIREVMNDSFRSSESFPLPDKGKKYSSDILPVPNELTSLKRENQDLKLELVKMNMRLRDIEKSSSDKSATSSPSGGATHSSADKPPLPRKSFISLVSKKLSKFSPFFRGDGAMPLNLKGQNKPSRVCRHSIS